MVLISKPLHGRKLNYGSRLKRRLCLYFEFEKKPKRISIPKNLDPNLIDLKAAADLLSLPREVGTHPETGEKIVANIGPFGPYLLHNKVFTSVKDDNILEIGLNRAVDVIATAAEKPAISGSCFRPIVASLVDRTRSEP